MRRTRSEATASTATETMDIAASAGETTITATMKDVRHTDTALTVIARLHILVQGRPNAADVTTDVMIEEMTGGTTDALESPIRTAAVLRALHLALQTAEESHIPVPVAQTQDPPLPTVAKQTVDETTADHHLPVESDHHAEQNPTIAPPLHPVVAPPQPTIPTPPPDPLTLVLLNPHTTKKPQLQTAPPNSQPCNPTPRN